MKRWTRFLILIAIPVAAVDVAAQPITADEQQALRARIEQRYDVVPLTDGLALRPKSPRGDLRLIEISDTIVVNGVPVSGRELRERVGADADAILRLSYLDATTRRALFDAARAEPMRPEAERAIEPSPSSTPDVRSRPRRRSGGERVRIFGDVVVAEGEEISGQVVAVLGDVRIDGEVDDQVVAVLGSVDLGPHAVVRGDVVTVGGRLRRAEGAQVRGAVTEVALGDPGVRINMHPWFDGWGPIHLFGGFGPVARLIGSTVRFGLLALVVSIALVVARRSVENSAQRVADNPVKATLIGLASWILFVPLFVVTVFVLSISIIGIPLLLLVPFALLVLLLMAVVGFSGTVYAVGQWTRRRIGIATMPAFIDVCLGLLVILMPLLLGRVVALAGWPLTPIVFLLLATGLAVEFLAWASGFGAVITNTFARWAATQKSEVRSQN